MKETGSTALRLGYTRIWNIPTPPLFYTPIYVNQQYIFQLQEAIRDTIHILIINSKLLYTHTHYIFHTYSHLLMYNKRVRDKFQYKLGNPKFTKHIYKFLPAAVRKLLIKQTSLRTYRHLPRRLLVPYKHTVDVPLSKEVGLMWIRQQAKSGHVSFIPNRTDRLACTLDLFRNFLHRHKRKTIRLAKKRGLYYTRVLWPNINKLVTTTAQAQLVHKYSYRKRTKQIGLLNKLKLLYRIDKIRIFRNINTFNKPHLSSYEQPIKPASHIQYRNQIYSNIGRTALELFIQDKITTPITVLQHSLWNSYISGKRGYQQTRLLIQSFRIFAGLAHRRIYIYDIILVAYYALIQREPHPLVVFITHELARTKYHRFIIYFFTRQLLNYLVITQTKKFRTTHGFSCALYGPIGKHGRTKKILFTRGHKPRGQFYRAVTSARSEANTFYGTLGLRLWIV